MNKKLILPIILMLLVGIVIFVSAQEPSFSIPIKKGWNLIPMITPESVVSGSPIVWADFKYSYLYIPHKKDYVMIVGPEDKIDPMDSSTTINQREAEQLLRSSVWVYSEKEGSLVIRIDEDVAEQYFYPPKFELDSGWNFIWITPYMADKNLNDLKGDCNIEKSYGWWAERQTWDLIDLNDAPFNQNMAGQGFIVKVSNNCAMGTDSSINPPSIPN